MKLQPGITLERSMEHSKHLIGQRSIRELQIKHLREFLPRADGPAAKQDKDKIALLQSEIAQLDSQIQSWAEINAQLTLESTGLIDVFVYIGVGDANKGNFMLSHRERDQQVCDDFEIALAATSKIEVNLSHFDPIHEAEAIEERKCISAEQDLAAVRPA